MTFAGRSAVVTGGGSGIGRATVLRLAGAGARVAVLDVDEAAIGRVVDEVLASHGEAIGVRCDVSAEAEVEGAIARVVEAFGSVEILVNNAGISPPERVPIDELDLERWERVLRVNLTGTFLCAKHVVRVMKSGKGGVIVNVSSVAGLSGIPFVHAYGASKHGVVGLTRELAVELAPHGIRVNAVAPGTTDTDLYRGGASTISAAQLEGIRNHTPAGRVAVPEEIAEAIVYLASDAASYVTGAVLPVDGGSLAGRVNRV